MKANRRAVSSAFLSVKLRRAAGPLAGTLAMLLGGCQAAPSSLPHGAQSYSVIPAAAAGGPRREYRIGPLDVLNITVFQEPDLSLKENPVDASGNISLPLIGDVRAAGKTAAELAREITTRLNERYLRNAQVSVVVVISETQQVTVEGNVNQPGVYEIKGSSTLLEALALAKSPTRVARLDQVVVFRAVDGQRMGAVFDVNKIRAGKSPDPELLGGDVVVVGFSAVKGAFRDFLTSVPLVYYVFQAF